MTKMKFYIASKFTNKEKVRELQKHLKSLGHEITHDWTTHEDMRPFINNQKIAGKYAKEDLDGVRSSDVFIALCDDAKGSVGMHTEIGAAISSFLDKGKPSVYVLGKELDAMFYFHPAVKRIKSIDELLKIF